MQVLPVHEKFHIKVGYGMRSSFNKVGDGSVSYGTVNGVRILCLFGSTWGYVRQGGSICPCQAKVIFAAGIFR